MKPAARTLPARPETTANGTDFLSGTAGTPGWEPTEAQLPGLPTAQLLVDTAAAAGVPDPTAAAQCLWAGMHGLITLRQDRPSFPWLPLDHLVDTLVGAHLATGR